METDSFKISIGNLGVMTTENRGHTPEEVAEMATEKIISVSDTAPPQIKAQAHAFKNVCYKIIAYYMHEAIKNHMCTIGNQLEPQGHKDLHKQCVLLSKVNFCKRCIILKRAEETLLNLLYTLAPRL